MVLGHVRCQMMLSDILEVEVNETAKGFKKCYEYELVCSLEKINKPAIVSKDGISGIMMNKSTISFGGNPLLGKKLTQSFILQHDRCNVIYFHRIGE